MNTDTDHPMPHMRELPAECVARIADLIEADFAGALPITLRFEVEAWRNTRTVWDAERVAKACAHAYRRPWLAAEVRDLIAKTEPSGVLAQLKRERAP